MKLNKGLRFIAIGFLFTLVNLNITIDTHTINVTPDFVGWFLIFLGLGYLKNEAKGNLVYRVVAVLLSLITLGLWIVSIVYPKMDLSLYKSIAGLITALYIFFLLGLLAKIARKYGSSHGENLKVLKYVYLIVYILFQAVAFAGAYLPVEVLTVLGTITGIGALITAVATAIVLFKLSFDIEEKTEN